MRLHENWMRSGQRAPCSLSMSPICWDCDRKRFRWNQAKPSRAQAQNETLLALNISSIELSDFYEPADARLWLYSPQKLFQWRPSGRPDSGRRHSG